MAKEDIFSKINLKDYNNMLEGVLEQKIFSEDVKNLLLSMLYKIENGYQDYEKVKVNVSNKKYFLKKIIKIIKEKCNEIILIKPMSEEGKELEEQKVNYIINKEDGIIKVYPNERMILEALVELNQDYISVEDQYNIFKIGLQEVLARGNKMNISEVIRDFNGWSWDITISQMESKNINIVYQNLLILLGSSFLQKWISGAEKQEEEEYDIPNNEILRSKYNDSFGMTKEEVQEDNSVDYMKKMQQILIEKYGEINAEEFINQLIKTVIAIGSNKNKEQKEIIIKKQKSVEEKLEKMQDNKKYLETLSKYKKDITKQIKQIDTFLTDEKSLREEYDKRNSTLPNNKKIFSVSHLKIMLEKEREKHLNQIKLYNKQMEPNEFIRIKNDLEEKLDFYKDINVKGEEKTDEEKQIIKLQDCFMDCFKEKIKKVQNKNDIKNSIYELRYYEKIPFQSSSLSEINTIKAKLEIVEKLIINIACKDKILTLFSKQESLNNKILKNVLQSKIINLENSVYMLKYHKGILKILIYDTNIEEETKEIQITERTELEVRLNKKIKVWE